MSKLSLAILLTLVAGFAAFEVFVNYELRSVNDHVLEVCWKPVKVEPYVQAFYLSADEVQRPMRRGTMR